MFATNRCEFCMRVTSMLDNPYQYSGQVLAKLCVNVATGIWAGVVLVKQNALANWPGFDAVSPVLGEDWLAALVMVLSILATLRLIYKRAPILIGACVYGLFLLLWLYTWISLMLAISAGLTAMRPGQLGAVSVITFLAFFAFVSNPK